MKARHAAISNSQRTSYPFCGVCYPIRFFGARQRVKAWMQEDKKRSADTTFEPHYSIKELVRQWHLSRETVRTLIKDESGVVKVRMGRKKAMTRYSVPESVARRIHTRLLNPTP